MSTTMELETLIKQARQSLKKGDLDQAVELFDHLEDFREHGRRRADQEGVSARFGDDANIGHVLEVFAEGGGHIAGRAVLERDDGSLAFGCGLGRRGAGRRGEGEGEEWDGQSLDHGGTSQV